jgi:hypothetical protein
LREALVGRSVKFGDLEIQGPIPENLSSAISARYDMVDGTGKFNPRKVVTPFSVVTLYVSLLYIVFLIPNPFHVLQENLLTAAVVEFRSPAVVVPGDSLRGTI